LFTNTEQYNSVEDLQAQHIAMSVVYRDEDGFYDITGVMRPVLKMFVMKYYTIKNWVQYSEVHGYPVSTISIPKSQYNIYKKEIARFLNSVGKNRYGVLFDNWKYEIKDINGSGGDVFSEFINFCNTEIEIAVLGQSATTQMSGGGYSAVTTYKKDEIDNIVDDCEIIDESITDDIVKPYIKLNTKLNPDDFSFKHRIPKNINEVVKKYESAARMGLKVSKKKFEEEMDLTLVDSGEDSLELKFESKGIDIAQEPEKRKVERKDGGKIGDK